ncbi:MAG: exonuclease domain-containing protein [Rhodocyclaceae bacterium]|jgi:DNA polymerase-3 subunit epsilon|nr:DNA polymerase III subunit epsilon [Rhodocyclaceae bacterium]MCO5098634.1 exonuclease domain-containing protein [Rhodocyclaceae bacterium]
MAGRSGRLKLALVLAGIYILLAILFCALGAVLWADMKAAERQAFLAIMMPRIELSVLIILMAWAVLGMIVHVIYRAYVLAPMALREQALVMVNANPSLRLQELGAPEIRTLAQVVNALAEQRESLQRDVEDKIREARSSIEEEKNRLAALMSELTQSVVVCNLEGRILLYNNRARLQFRALSEGAPAAAAGLIGLGRSIFAILERNLITHALDSIQQRLARGSQQPVANFVTTSRAGQLIRVQMAAVLGAARADEGSGEGARAIVGYILMLDNITRNFEMESRRDELLQSLTEGSRASLGIVRAAVENLLEYPDMDAAQRDRFVGIVRDEVGTMSQRLDRTATEFSDALKARWPLEDMLGEDLIEAARRRIEQKLTLRTKKEDVAEGLWIKVDSFSLLQGLIYLASRLQDEYDIREIRFRLEPAGRLAHIDLVWSGAVMSSQTLLSWEIDPMSVAGANSPLTLREVIERHGGEIWFEREKASHKSFIRLLIPAAAPKEAVETTTLLRAQSRPEYYDFDLFQQTEESQALDDRLLTELTYTVFDTETTGLEPSAGDEIIQIGATRIVNGRLLKSESIDQIIDPRRPLRPEGIPIHGITEDMVVGQPTIQQVLPVFHAFSEDTVLVAHNAAFDMRFLQLKEESTGIRFRQPVLDTLLLSAVIHPNQESHKLEAICERLGINVIGRHTALGDAIVTGEVFLKMVPLLADMDIRTLREAREAAARTYYARVKY